MPQYTLRDRVAAELWQRPRLHSLVAWLRQKPLIPLAYPHSAKSRYGHGQPPHPLLQKMIEGHRERYLEHLKSFHRYQADFTNIPRKKYWHNAYLPALDAASLYSFIALKKPARYLEVGSGVSTTFVRRAVTHHSAATRIISIDPAPRAEINHLCDQVIRRPLELVDLAFFDQLTAGDCVFIDNSHQSFPNSDVTVFFLDILPNLAPGVLVGIHDIFLPDDYPPAVARQYYSEQYLLAAYLLGNKAESQVIIELPAWFVSHDAALKPLVDSLFSLPHWSGIDTHGGAFWFTTQ